MYVKCVLSLVCVKSDKCVSSVSSECQMGVKCVSSVSSLIQVFHVCVNIVKCVKCLSRQGQVCVK